MLAQTEDQLVLIQLPGGFCPALVIMLSSKRWSQVGQQKKSGRLFNLPQVTENNGEPSRARTCDPLIKSEFIDTPAGHGFYDLLTFVIRLQPPASLSVTVYYFQFVCVLVTSLSQSVRLWTERILSLTTLDSLVCPCSQLCRAL